MSQEYLTVTALTKYLKRKFDCDPHLGRVYLTGEISNFRMRPNTHQYFSLKDDGAVISAVMFKGAFQKIKFQPEEGMKVLVVGRVSLFEKSGNYQIYIEHMEPDGVGALYQAYEQLKKKLTAEGLFQLPKKAIPRFPKKIAIITSQSGAVIEDIKTTVQRRYPIVQLVLYPAVVQGEHSVPSLLKALKEVEANGTYDTVIIGRGGGSIEDLWSFNDERVVRQIATMQTPLISSVGHETDTTLTDLVADVRAATPTAAAEIATPVLVEIKEQLLQLEQQLIRAMGVVLQFKREQLERLAKTPIFQQPERLYEAYVQRLDHLATTLNLQAERLLQGKRQALTKQQQQLLLQSPASKITKEQQTLAYLTERLEKAQTTLLANKQKDLSSLMEQLDLLSPLKIMQRGYGIVETGEKVIRSVADVALDEEITITLTDGMINANVISKQEVQRDKGE
ncbi:exodeoxyribonuclease VII large subunit [Granulicatella balaenopterae]|uniref:exodeoxyribonuclease VII large subunit n=1 Tax=Granulicatella balaenopterae TaxID=137733 RepID=UPI0015A57E13|nr:exodeoxyribonuclease VII large subunit [Granulicatella balaenopterae]